VENVTQRGCRLGDAGAAASLFRESGWKWTMSALRIVTDGAADLPPDVAATLGIEIVRGPVHCDGSEWFGSSAEFWRQVADGMRTSTGPPSVDDFTRAFAGRDPVYAVLVSAELSRTVEHAERATESGGPVCIVDSRSLSVGTGLVAVEAAQVARDAADLSHLKLLLARLVDQVHLYAVIENVDYLVRGGRTGLVAPPGRAGWRRLLAVKGHVIPLEEVHHRRKAVDVLLRHVCEHASHGVGEWAVGHGGAADVDEFVDKAQRVLGGFPRFVVPLGPPMGTHAGPDALVLGFLAEG
jgi:DegV family protein with EDD domain